MQHFTVSLTAGSVEHSPPHQWKASHSGHLHFKEILSRACKHFQQQSYVMPLLHLKTSNNPKMNRCNMLYLNYGYNVTFNFDYTLSWFNDEFATYKGKRSSPNGFLPDVYQMWNEVIWLTPEIGHLISTAPIFWEQIEPPPEVSQQIKYSDWKHLGFLPQEICNIIIPLFSNANSGPTFVCPGSDWDWISQSCWLAPIRTYWICGSYLWVWLPPGDIGRCTQDYFIISELPEKPAKLPHLKSQWERSVLHWYDYLGAMFPPSL